MGNEQELRKYKNLLMQKRYSKNTIKVYCAYFFEFCKYFEHKNLQEIHKNEINQYIKFD